MSAAAYAAAVTTRVKISAADVKYIMEELETSKEETEAALQQCEGDVTRALKHLLH
jgi:NACalpha-BTF3-like transcription factor